MVAPRVDSRFSRGAVLSDILTDVKYRTRQTEKNNDKFDVERDGENLFRLLETVLFSWHARTYKPIALVFSVGMKLNQLSTLVDAATEMCFYTRDAISHCR